MDKNSKASEGQKAPSARILVVDDSMTVRRLVSMVLERHGYQVAMAKDGMEALARINEKCPVMIFLDITMPRMDGYQLCKLIRHNPQTKKVPIVMLSAKDGFFDKMKGKMAGATDYITKPFNAEVLLRAVKKHIRKGMRG